jgi:hypothetical protein
MRFGRWNLYRKEMLSSVDSEPMVSSHLYTPMSLMKLGYEYFKDLTFTILAYFGAL